MTESKINNNVLKISSIKEGLKEEQRDREKRDNKKEIKMEIIREKK